MFRSREYASQLKDFSGLRFGRISPTDIDAMLEFGDKVYVIIEAKHGTADMPVGQKLALTRLTDALGENRHAMLIQATHDATADIDLGNCKVAKYYYKQRWWMTEMSVRELVDSFLENFGVA